MIQLLRFVGVANAAVWLGAAIFYTLAVAPGLASHDSQVLLGQSFPYYSGAIGQIIITRYFHLQLACSIVALLHVMGEWLYLGRTSRKIWIYILITMFWAALIGSVWLGPKLRETHRAQYLVKSTAAERDAAAKSFRICNGVFQSLNLFIIAGVAIYLWRVSHPPDELRFVGSSKIRG